LALGKYAAAFVENEIDETILPNLTAEDLKELGTPPQLLLGNQSRKKRPPTDAQRIRTVPWRTL
jgi:hypothetical protein